MKASGMKALGMKSTRAVLAVALGGGLALMAAPSDAKAERSCKYVKRLNEELGCGLVSRDEEDDDDLPRASRPEKQKEFVMNKAFGPTECKIGSAAKEAVKEYKAECDSWLKERRKELKDKYQTGTCADQMDACSVGGVSGKAGTVQGVIHYSK